MSLKNMPHEKLPFRAAYFVYVKEKLIFFHDYHAPWFQRKRMTCERTLIFAQSTLWIALQNLQFAL